MATKDRTSLKNDFANGKYATGEKFADLIDSMKVVQLPVVDPQALGTSLSFIDSITQDADGKITATKKTLDLANAHELNPFKGWYETGDTLPTDGFDGAYLYFKDTSELTGQTTIYRWNGTTYADTGTVVDTSNVQTFGSGQAVNDVKIKDENGEEVTGNADVLSAEAGQEMNEAIFGNTEIRYVEQILESNYYYNTHIDNGDYISLSKTRVSANYACLKFDVSAGDTFRIAGLGGGSYILLYATCASSENNAIIRKAAVNTNTRTEPLLITIEEGEGILVVNMADYDSTVDKVEKAVEVTEGGIFGDIGNLNNLTTEHKDNLVNAINEINSEIKLLNDIEIILPNKIYAVVGDTLQLFYSGMVKAKNVYNYDIRISCAHGNQYRRYYQYTPTTDDIGTTIFNVEVRNNRGELLATKDCSLVTVSAPTSPESQKNIVCLGDSLTSEGVWVEEACRRLIGTGGNPDGKELNNITFCGSLRNVLAGYFGAGGWTWGSYISKGADAYRFTVSGVTSVGFRNVYTNNGYTFTVQEVNISNGSGTILCSTTAGATPETSGVLLRQSGGGDEQIVFSNAVYDIQNPLWDETNNKMSFLPYAQQYCGGQIDVVYVLLTWNGLTTYKSDFSSMILQMKTFADVLHSEFPSAKLKIMSVPLPSHYDSHVYASLGKFENNSYSDSYGLAITALNMAKIYQMFADSEEESGTSGDTYSTFVEYVGIPCQYDCEYSSQLSKKLANTRIRIIDYLPNTKYELGTFLKYQNQCYVVTSIILSSSSSFPWNNVQLFDPYETVTGNTVHPANTGYMQIADAVYRNIVANFCQGV